MLKWISNNLVSILSIIGLGGILYLINKIKYLLFLSFEIKIWIFLLPFSFLILICYLIRKKLNKQIENLKKEKEEFKLLFGNEKKENVTLKKEVLDLTDNPKKWEKDYEEFSKLRISERFESVIFWVHNSDKFDYNAVSESNYDLIAYCVSDGVISKSRDEEYSVNSRRKIILRFTNKGDYFVKKFEKDKAKNDIKGFF